MSITKWEIIYKEDSDIAKGIKYGDNEKLFLTEDKLKDESKNLYLYCEVENGHLYGKFGEAFKESVFDRYNRTGHKANGRMLRVWESSIHDTEVLKYLSGMASNKLGFHVADYEILNTREAFLIDSYEALLVFINLINKYLNKDPESEKRNTPVYPDIIELVESLDIIRFTKFCLDLCTRWGKTKTNLLLMKKTKCRIHLMCAYVGTVRKSYLDDILHEFIFQDFLFIDPDVSGEDTVKRVQDWLDSDPNHHVFYYIQLTGTFNGNDETFEDMTEEDISTFQRRCKYLYSLKKYSFDMFVEETDFGAHCEKQVKKIRRLYKDLKCRYFFSTTGTNAEKTNLIFNCDRYIKRDYICDVLGNPNNGRKNPTKISWTVLNNSSYLCEGFAEKGNFENFTDLFKIESIDGQNHFKGEEYFTSLFNYLFKGIIVNGNPLTVRRMKKIQKTLLDFKAATMIFTPVGYDLHECLANLLERTLGNDYLVKIIDGRWTTNSEAEEYAKMAIEAGKMNGKKIIFICSNMANRSFSVKEIKNIILLINDGSYASIQQKDARGFTPWEGHDVCHIIDFRLGYTISDSTCASKYLSGAGCDKMDSDGLDTAQSITEVINASEKIVFEELFFGEEDPLRKLTTEELDSMMHTTSYANRAVSILCDELIETIPEPKRCGIHEKPSKNLYNKNIKGDSDRRKSTKSNASSGESNENDGKSQEEKNSKMQHAYFVVNHPGYFNSNRFTSDIWTQEIEDISSDPERVSAFEESFDVDFEAIKSAVYHLLKRKILNDGMF